MLGAIYFNNQLCRSTVKVHNEFADDSLFVNLYRIFTQKKIPEFALMGSHFPAKPPGVFQLAVVLWYGHVFPSQSAAPTALPKGEPSSARNALHQTVYRSAHLYLFSTNWNLRISPCHQPPWATFRTRKPPFPTRIFFISIPWPTVILRRVKITFEHDALVKLFI